METIYLQTIPQPRPSEKVVELNAYRERRGLRLEGTALPESAALRVRTPMAEITPELSELPEPSVDALQRFLLWADAVASVVLIAGALLVLSAVL